MENEIQLPASKLTNSQFKTYGPRTITYNGIDIVVRAKVSYDDQCRNGHNSFSITGEYTYPGRSWEQGGGGCIHGEICAAFPELAPFIKWHHTSSKGPMHYVANTVYHATDHGPKSAWVYHKAIDVIPPGGGHKFSLREQCLKYCDIAEAEAIVDSNPAVYYIQIDEKTAKTANLECARSSAVWPGATQEQLLNKELLLARLPSLMEAFKKDVESLGFVY